MRYRLTFQKEPRDETYRSLLGCALETAASACLIVRPTIELDSRAQTALARLRHHEVGDCEVSWWPGTRLHGGATARRRDYRVSEALIRELASLAQGLYDWEQPDLPEDLGFLRRDGSVWLASISHEQDAYLEMSFEELEELKVRVPALAELIVIDSEDPLNPK